MKTISKAKVLHKDYGRQNEKVMEFASKGCENQRDLTCNKNARS